MLPEPDFAVRYRNPIANKEIGSQHLVRSFAAISQLGASEQNTGFSILSHCGEGQLGVNSVPRKPYQKAPIPQQKHCQRRFRSVEQSLYPERQKPLRLQYASLTQADSYSTQDGFPC